MNKISTAMIQEYNYQNIVAYFSEGSLEQFSKDQIIIDGSKEPDGAYLIKSGYVKARSISKANFGNILLIHDKGEIIPLPWAFNGASSTGLHYQAMSNVTVIKSSKEKLHLTMGSNAWLSQEVFKQSVDMISIYTQRIQTLEFKTARSRIIAELIHLTERFGVFDGKVFVINAPVTHQDIADSINMSRETASRCLELLFREGLVGQRGRLLLVINLDKLRLALK